MKLDLEQILTQPRKKRVNSLAHPGKPHFYNRIITPNNRVQFICEIAKCTHSLNIEQWIVGKETLCRSCMQTMIVQEDKKLTCENCQEKENG